MSEYQKLHEHFREIANFEHAVGILNWDDAAMMPTGSSDVRASSMETLSVHIHKLSSDPRIADWIASAREEDLDTWQSANVREIERGFTINETMPADLVAALSRGASEGSRPRVDGH